MKKFISILCILTMMMAFAGCGNTEESKEEASSAASTQAETTEEVTESEKEKALVVYFSCTGTTKGIAEKMAEGLDAEIYEIVPEEPYTEEDLDYNDDNSRTSIEMNDTSVRPEISGSIEEFAQYETIYLGYPIWWGEAPRIMDTFVESYDFDGKTIIPFCTSGGSGIGSSADRLEELAGSGEWQSGQRFSGEESIEELMEWIQGLK